MPAENTIRSVSSALPSAKRMRCARVAAVDDLDGASCRCGRRRPSSRDARAQHAAAGIIDLHGHQARRELDHVGLQPQILERLRRFEAQQAAADDHAASWRSRWPHEWLRDPRWCDRRSSRAGRARYRGHEGIGAGGQHQAVVIQSARPLDVSTTRALAIDARPPARTSCSRCRCCSKKPGSAPATDPPRSCRRRTTSGARDRRRAAAPRTAP